MNNVKFTIIKNWLMSKNGNDYWVYTKYHDNRYHKIPLGLLSMEFFLDSPFDANGKDITKKELVWLMWKSKRFNIHDEFMYFENGELRSGNKVFPNMLNVNDVAKYIIETNDCLENDELKAILDMI